MKRTSLKWICGLLSAAIVYSSTPRVPAQCTSCGSGSASADCASGDVPSGWADGGCYDDSRWTGTFVLTYHNDVTVTTTYDAMGRSTTETAPSGGVGDYVTFATMSAAFVNCPGQPMCHIVVPGCAGKQFDKLGQVRASGSDLPNPPPCDSDDGSGKAQQFGGATGSTSSLHLYFNVGRIKTLEKGNSNYDYLWVQAQGLTTDVFQPASLIHRPTIGITEVRSGGVIRQLISSEGLTDVLSVAGGGYDVRFYRVGQYGTTPGADGTYPINANTQPFSIWKVRDLTAGSATEKRLELSEWTGIVQKSSILFVQNVTTNTWNTVANEGDHRVDVTVVPTGLNRTTKTRIVTDPLHPQVTVAKSLTVYEGGKVIEQHEGEGAAEIVTYYQYDGDDLALTVREENNVVSSWERRVRGFSPRQPTRYLPLADDAVPGKELNGAYSLDLAWYEAHGRKIQTTAALLTFDEIETESLLVTGAIHSTKTTRSYSTCPDSSMAGKIVAEEVTRYATPDDPATALHSYNSRFADDTTPNTFLAGRLYFVVSEDGKAARYAYALDQPNASNPPVGLFETVIRGEAESGKLVTKAFVSTKEDRYYDASGNLLTERLYACTTGGSTPVFAPSPYNLTVHTYVAGHRTLTTLNGRTIYSATWSGDRLTSEKDEIGVNTTFSNFDAQERSLRATRSGVALTNGLPAIPSSITDTVYDAAGRRISDTTTSGGLSMVRSWTYDTAGRRTSESLQYGAEQALVTTYVSDLGGHRITQTLPSGTTQITETYLNGESKSITGSAALQRTFQHFYVSENQNIPTGWKWEQEDAGDPAVPITTHTFLDMLGRVRVINEAGLEHRTDYDSSGRANLESQTGLAPQITAYEFGNGPDGQPGVLKTTTQDSGTDGIRTRITSEHFEQAGTAWLRVRATSRGVTKEKLSGLGANVISEITSTDALGNTTTETTTADRTTTLVTRTVVRSGFQNAVTLSRLGLVQSVSTPSVMTPAIFGYDGLGRGITAKDPRTQQVTTTDYANAFGQPSQESGPSLLVTMSYYPAGSSRVGKLMTRTENGKTTRFDYDTQGRMTYTWGATYPVRYEYNSNGLLWKMHTYRLGDEAQWSAAAWPGGAGEGDVTIWTYEQGTRRLALKNYAGQNVGQAQGTTYGYHGSGLLAYRAWVRQNGAVQTTYNYNLAGELKGITYSGEPAGQQTPPVTFGYDAEGRMNSLTDAAGAHTMAYDDLGQLESEAIAGGVLDGLVLDPHYTNAGWKGRLDGLQANLSGTGLASASYGYEPSTGRLQTVGDGVQTAAYAYKADSDSLWTTTMTRGGQPALKVERGYDTAGRQTFLETTRGAQMVERHEWGYDAAGQRSRDTMGDGTKWEYGYDGKGEVTGGVRRQTDVNIVVPGHEYGYGFDAIGNRTTTTVNGRTTTYTPNMRNQYEQRTVPGAVDVLGVALPGALVLANGVEAVRQGGNFAATVTVNNATAQHPSLNIKAVAPGSPGSPDLQAEDGGRVFVPATPEIFTHDEDGNLTGDGRWTYEWDAENRLRAMVTRTDLPATVPRLRLEFSYDARSRRIEKKVKTLNAGTTSYVLSQRIKYLYDEGWNLLAEVDGNNAVLRKYVWGLDLSRSRQGAGGVGGLLVETSGNTDYLTCYDGNGNITGLIKADDGQQAATYTYGPFGEPLRATGPMAQGNPFKFSTKYTDEETGLVYYGRRFYDPNKGRWINRDPIEEDGGVNLYACISNDLVSKIDYLGLKVDKYDEDTNALPLWKKPGLGVEGKTYPTTAFGHNDHMGLYLTVSGSLKLSLYYDPNRVSDPTQGPPFDMHGRTVAGHERLHAWIFKKWWNAMADDANSLEGTHCKACMALAIQLFKKMTDVYMDAAGEEQETIHPVPLKVKSPDWTGLQNLKDKFRDAKCW